MDIPSFLLQKRINVMSNKIKLKIRVLSTEKNPINFKEQQKLANQCLNKITMLQKQLNMEEEKLMQLLKNSATAIYD